MTALMFTTQRTVAYRSDPKEQIRQGEVEHAFELPTDEPVLLLDAAFSPVAGRHVQVLSTVGLVYVYEFALNASKRER